MVGRGKQLASLLLLGFGGLSCAPEQTSDRDDSDRRAIHWAPHSFGGVIPSPARNPLTPAGIALGRRLFYDRSLSADGNVSCATCHRQSQAFGDAQALASSGVSGERLARHAPVLQNLAWLDEGLFWDGGASDLESLMAAPLTDEHEMAADPEQLVAYLGNDSSYPEAFAQAFGAEPSIAFVMRALAQFVRTLISAQSPYDDYIAGHGSLSVGQLNGLRVFERACATCHPAPFFTDHKFHNLGFETQFSDDPEDVRKGRGRITESPAHYGQFKTPSLRNVTRSAPYLHDGRMDDLRAVLERYRSGIELVEGLDPVFRRQDGRLGLQLSTSEIDDLEAFLGALEDPHFFTNPDWGAP